MNTISKSRISSIDLLRGLVMVIMALDHTRDFFHYDAFLHDPLDLKTTSPLLFFTRWITHYCAPVFVFLAGISIYLQSLRKPVAELSKFLFKRGLWLIFVEVVLISFAWSFDFSYRAVVLQVIWAIGISMFLMGILIRLPFNLMLIIGLLIVTGHNVVNYINFSEESFWIDLTFKGNFSYYHLFSNHSLVIIYPFLSWLGLMIMGFIAGRIFNKDLKTEVRRSMLLWLGAGLIVLFVIIRMVNGYGDPAPWQSQGNFLYSLFSFVNVTKYPPSLMFMLMTIGPALIFLAFAENINNRLTRILTVFGKVPFFYYILHFYVLHAAVMILFMVRGHSFFEKTPDIFGIPFNFMIAGEGYRLSVVYLVWMLVVIGLYPLCKWFSRLKSSGKYWWMSYL